MGREFSTLFCRYKPGETYESKFGRLGSTLEECRAETVATYLGLSPTVLKIWGLNESAAELQAYLLWLEEATEGLEGLAEYKPESDTWGEAHAQGRFAILHVMIESGVANVSVTTGKDGQPDLLISLDRKRIHTDGRRAMGEFLMGLEVNQPFTLCSSIATFVENVIPNEGNSLHLKVFMATSHCNVRLF